MHLWWSSELLMLVTSFAVGYVAWALVRLARHDRQDFAVRPDEGEQ